MSRPKPPTVELDYCIACGCTEFSPCETGAGPCAWLVYPRASGRGMCTRCADHYLNPTATFAQVEALLSSRELPALPPAHLRGRFPDHGKPRKPVRRL